MEQLINADPHGRIALQGYDPVAFHTAGKPMKGDPYISADYLGYKYLFSSEANKAKFEQQSKEYLPAYGGYCAYGITLDTLAPVEIDTWDIIDGRLVLQFSQGVKQKFGEQLEENIRKANDKWSTLEAGSHAN